MKFESWQKNPPKRQKKSNRREIIRWLSRQAALMDGSAKIIEESNQYLRKTMEAFQEIKQSADNVIAQVALLKDIAHVERERQRACFRRKYICGFNNPPHQQKKSAPPHRTNCLCGKVIHPSRIRRNHQPIIPFSCCFQSVWKRKANKDVSAGEILGQQKIKTTSAIVSRWLVLFYFYILENVVMIYSFIFKIELAKGEARWKDLQSVFSFSCHKRSLLFLYQRRRIKQLWKPPLYWKQSISKYPMKMKRDW